MAKTNAQRQAEYRAKQRKNMNPDDYAKLDLKQINALKERLDVTITHEAKQALKRLALHHGVTQADMLIKVLLDTDNKIKKSLHGNELHDYIFKPLD